MTPHHDDPLRVAERAIIDLQDSIKLSGDDHPKTEALREAFENVWRTLSSEHRRYIQRLSAELDMLVGDEAERPKGQDRYRVEDRSSLTKMVKHLFAEKKWDRMLDVLRDNPHLVDAERLAAMRSAAYNGLSRLEPALVFLRHAVSIDPAPAYVAALLSILGAAGQWVELDATLAPIENEAVADSDLLVAAAAALSCSLRAHKGRQQSPEASNIAGRIVKLTQRALSAKPSDLMRTARGRAIAFSILAHSEQTLGNAEAAYRALRNAVQLEPNRGYLWAALAVAGAKFDAESSVDALERAIALGIEDVHAYLIVASRMLRRHDFQRLLELAKDGLEFTNTPRERAIMLHLLAISRFERGASLRVVERDFAQALELAPEDITIRQNYELMKSRAMKVPAATAWTSLPQQPDELRSREFDFLPKPDPGASLFTGSAFASLA